MITRTSVTGSWPLGGLRLADDLHRRRRAEAGQRQEADRARGLDARQRVDLLEEAVEELPALTLGAVSRVRQRQPHRHRARRIEAGILIEQPDEAAHQQAGADEQHERQRDLDDDERRCACGCLARPNRSVRLP